MSKCVTANNRKQTAFDTNSLGTSDYKLQISAKLYILGKEINLSSPGRSTPSPTAKKDKTWVVHLQQLWANSDHIWKSEVGTFELFQLSVIFQGNYIRLLWINTVNFSLYLDEKEHIVSFSSPMLDRSWKHCINFMSFHKLR